MWRSWGLTALFAASLLLTSGALPASDNPVVHVKATVSEGTVRMVAQATGPFEYTTYRPTESLYVLDMSGVSAGDPSGARVIASNLVKSYRVLTYTSGQKPVVRLEILLSDGVEPRVEKKDSNHLELLISRTPRGAAAPNSATTSTTPSLRPVAAKPTDSEAAPATLGTIHQVNLTQSNGQTEVNVVGSGPLTYHAIRLQNPERLVLDFAGSQLRTPVKQIASNLEPVREIRLAQFTRQVSRVVIDLRQPARYDISASGSAVKVSFASIAPGNGAIKSAPAEASSNLETTKLGAPKAAPIETPAIPAPAAVLPAALVQSSSALAAPVTASGQPREASSTVQGGSQASSLAASAATTSSPVESAPAANGTGSVMAPSAGAPAASTNAPQAAAPAISTRYSGEPISVNLKDVDLRDFFRLIHEISGLNVVVDPSVKGNLTIVLDDVPWDQALDIVLRNNDLEKQLDGNVLRVATKETVKKEAEENRDLARAQAEAADVVTTTRVLSYAKASDMVTTLKKFLSSRGDILADPRSNTLIIRDVPSTFPVMDNLLRQLDRKSQQVEIEARVVAANRSFSREIGTQLAFALGSGNSTFGGTSSVGTSPVTHYGVVPPLFVGTAGTNPPSGAMPLNTNLGVATPTSGFSYIFQSANFALDFMITAAEDRGVGKLLSKPKITTQNNQKATVKQGTKIPVQTIINNTVSVQFVDAVLELDVTPQITAEGTVHLDVTVENDQIDQSIPRVEGIPAIDTQSAETSVTINDGQTIVVGGIIVSSQRTDIQQVPVFGSLPLVGNLFKHTTVNSTSQELLFFLTPRILPS
jgi:type IV pilus assembly protein PilQ